MSNDMAMRRLIEAEDRLAEDLAAAAVFGRVYHFHLGSPTTESRFATGAVLHDAPLVGEGGVDCAAQTPADGNGT